MAVDVATSLVSPMNVRHARPIFSPAIVTSTAKMLLTPLFHRVYAVDADYAMPLMLTPIFAHNDKEFAATYSF